jgi:Eukaryotic aspartyl protease
VKFDTGSSDLFVPSIDCKQKCTGHNLFNASASITAVDLGKTFSIPHPLGTSVSGEQYSETIHIDNIPAVSQTIGVADIYSPELDGQFFPPDGFLGVAFQSISFYDAPSAAQALYAQGELDQPVFAFKLTKQGAELSIGAVNPTLYTGEIYYTPVTRQVSSVLQIRSDFS